MADIQTLGRYEIRRELGRGAMGVVYEAYDPMIKRVVALKTIRADRLSPDEASTIVARFRREAEAAGRLHHPNIVSIFDFGEDGGTSYIAMEFVEGRDLKSRFDAGERFATGDAVRLTAQILDALQYSHEHGVIHRDIKPANVFVKDDGSVKVADFGIAHLESSSLTQAGSVMGTPSSMSPEQVLGLPVDARTDVFSTGVILYQFVTGGRPFGGAQSTTTMQKVLKEEPLPPTTLNVQLPDLMDEIVRTALAKKPEERYPSAAEFAQALRALAMPAPPSR
ncbi:MAG TPA: serine/threonine-protein kinase, partial [Casimicrobiaceae bacterium]|nr:serine/threonine-protein kinase [Casimicrobiaceae bacterium]